MEWKQYALIVMGWTIDFLPHKPGNKTKLKTSWATGPREACRACQTKPQILPKDKQMERIKSCSVCERDGTGKKTQDKLSQKSQVFSQGDSEESKEKNPQTQPNSGATFPIKTTEIDNLCYFQLSSNFKALSPISCGKLNRATCVMLPPHSLNSDQQLS